MEHSREQRWVAESLVAYWLRRMLADARNTQECTVEQVFDVLQRCVSRALIRRGRKPKDIGRRAEAMARDYKRSQVTKFEANEFQQFNDLAQPCLRLVPTDKE